MRNNSVMCIAIHGTGNDANSEYQCIKQITTRKGSLHYSSRILTHSFGELRLVRLFLFVCDYFTFDFDYYQLNLDDFCHISTTSLNFDDFY
jgi:hypothetical protein